MSFQVLLFCLIGFLLRVDGDIVHVDRKPSLSYFSAKDGVYHHLERGWGVSESKEHYCWFK